MVQVESGWVATIVGTLAAAVAVLWKRNESKNSYLLKSHDLEIARLHEKFEKCEVDKHEMMAEMLKIKTTQHCISNDECRNVDSDE